MFLPAKGESLVRVTAVGICGSDLHRYDSGRNNGETLAKPLVLGHEFAGVAETGPFKGRLVAVDPAITCGRCEWCLRGDVNLCPTARFAGTGSTDGALREYFNCPDKCLHPLPGGISPGGGAVLETLGVALHALDLGRVCPGESVAVLGCGPVGLLVIQAAKARGAKAIFATEILSHRLEAAMRLGASLALPAEDGQEANAISEATDGRGVDVVVEASGDPAAVDIALHAVRRGGRIVQVGIPPSDMTSFKASLSRTKGVTLLVARRSREKYAEAVQMVAEGKVDVESIVSHRFPLDKAAEAFDLAVRRGGLKIVVEP
jgi:L-iditol 2-dehydrogenase